MRSIEGIVLTVLVSLCFVLFAVAPASAEGGIPADDIELTDSALLWRVSFTDSAHLSSLAARIDVWEVDHTNHTVLALLSGAQAKALTEQGEVIVPEGSTRQRQLGDDSIGSTSSDHIPGFPCYRTTRTIEHDMASLAENNPDIALWTDIGDSWDKVRKSPPKGHDIHALVLTNRSSPAPKFRMLVVAAVHARELVTAEIALRFAEYLVEQYRVNPDVTWLLDYGEMHIVPLANPDGREFADQLYYWRKNTNSTDGCNLEQSGSNNYGVDLNRNSSFRWNLCESGRCSSSDPCSPTYRGRLAASEPETRALQNYGKSIFADQRAPGLKASAPLTTTGLMLSLHSYAEMVLFPWAWSGDPAPNAVGLRELGVRLAEPMGYTTCQTGEDGCLYQVDGDYADWSYGKLGIAAYTIEFGTEFFQQCSYFEDSILDAAIESLVLSFKYARMPYTLSSAPQIAHVELSQHSIEPGVPLTVTVTLKDVPAHTGDRVGFQYTLDEPSWTLSSMKFGHVLKQWPGGQTTRNVTGTIDTTSWKMGRHTLFVEGLIEGETAGIPTAVEIEVVGDQSYYLPFVRVEKSVTARHLDTLPTHPPSSTSQRPE